MIQALIPILASAGLNLTKKFVEAGSDKAVQLIKEKTGLDLTTKQSLTTDDIKALKQFEADNEERILDDIADARSMQKVALQQDDLFSKRFIYYYALAWSLFTFVFIPCVVFLEIPEKNIRFVDTIIGFLLGTVIAGIITFFFGSSHGSKQKTELLNKK